MPLIRNISDTALLAGVYRARETERPGGLFSDPFARRLVGERGEEIAKSLAHSERNAWAWIARTYLFDQFLSDRIEKGCDMIINLAAGLDARPYRMKLPPSLKWIEVDLPDILEYKEETLRGETPVCQLERVRLDLTDLEARRQLFARLGSEAAKAIIICEGLLIYFDSDEVTSLAIDLAREESFQYWLLDLASPPLLKMLQKTIGKPLARAAAPLKFAPPEGPDFFRTLGWNPIEARSMFHTAGKLKRLPLLLSILYHLNKSEAYQAKRPWGGVLLTERAAEL
jgi:methyltransferase (TIGR00027 family)